ncbi:MAG TPA: hypothetical protein VGC88_01095 [Terriglobales bacterium]
MSARSIAKAGMRDVLDRPLAITVELLWRWSFGGVATVLTALAGALSLSGAVITDQDEAALLRSGDVQTAANALISLAQQVGPAVLHQLLWLVPTLSVIWLVCATFGRAAACSALALRARADWGDIRLRPYLGPVARLQAARVATLLAAIALAAGSQWMAVSLGMRDANASLMFVVFGLTLVSWSVIGGAWMALNLILSIAPAALIEAARPQQSAFSQILRTWQRSNSAAVGVTVRFAGYKFLTFAGAFAASIAAVGAAAFFSATFSIALLLLITLGYFAAVDVLFLARMSAYARINGSPAGEEIYIRED